jgi:hypothetical protein
MIDVDHPQILTLFTHHRAAGRTDSAAFLIWYLENYYRLAHRIHDGGRLGVAEVA